MDSRYNTGVTGSSLGTTGSTTFGSTSTTTTGTSTGFGSGAHTGLGPNATFGQKVESTGRGVMEGIKEGFHEMGTALSGRTHTMSNTTTTGFEKDNNLGVSRNITNDTRDVGTDQNLVHYPATTGSTFGSSSTLGTGVGGSTLGSGLGSNTYGSTTQTTTTTSQLGTVPGAFAGAGVGTGVSNAVHNTGVQQGTGWHQVGHGLVTSIPVGSGQPQAIPALHSKDVQKLDVVKSHDQVTEHQKDLKQELNKEVLDNTTPVKPSTGLNTNTGFSGSSLSSTGVTGIHSQPHIGAGLTGSQYSTTGTGIGTTGYTGSNVGTTGTGLTGTHNVTGTGTGTHVDDKGKHHKTSIGAAIASHLPGHHKTTTTSSTTTTSTTGVGSHSTLGTHTAGTHTTSTTGSTGTGMMGSLVTDVKNNFAELGHKTAGVFTDLKGTSANMLEGFRERANIMADRDPNSSITGPDRDQRNV